MLLEVEVVVVSNVLVFVLNVEVFVMLEGMGFLWVCCEKVLYVIGNLDVNLVMEWLFVYMEDFDIDVFVFVGGDSGCVSVVDFEKLVMLESMGFGGLWVVKVFKEINGDVECVIEWFFSYLDDGGVVDEEEVVVLVGDKKGVGSVEFLVNF